MYKTVLVEQQIEEGRKLLEQLDAQPFPRRFPVPAALWYDYPEAARWRLVIISSIADRKGPNYGYTGIQEAQGKSKMTSLALDDITLVGMRDPEFIELKNAVGTPWPRSLGGRGAPAHRFEEPYVYRWSD
jgi:hypothetical protein